MSVAAPSVTAPPSSRRRALGVTADLFAATLWGFTGIIVTYSKTAPFVLTFYRLWISVALMLAALAIGGRRLTWRVLARATPSGVLLGANLTAYVFAFRLTSIADASVIGALQPALVLVLAAVFFGESVGVREVLLTFVAIAGVAGVVVAGTTASAGAHHLDGDLIAAFGTLAFTGYWLFAKSARRQIPTLEFMCGVWLSAAIAITPVAIVSGESFTVTAVRDWAWIVALAIVPGVGHVLMNWGHRYVDASVSAVIAILNAPVAAVAALVILGQALSLFQIGCGSVAVMAIALVARGRPRAAGELTNRARAERSPRR
jgi:drug/metabolite transporter (DMT)-like permease